MEMVFEFEGIVKGKTDQQLADIIRQADAANSTARLVIARNDMIKALAQHRLIGLQLREDAE